jgi:nucleolar GTP-binding protein
MVVYNFKVSLSNDKYDYIVYVFDGLQKITPIPSSTEMIDISLTRTQRKTPTVIHPGYKITRIRHFYMRKVKFTQQSIDEKLGAILQDFPRLDDIHPFYADLMNILYDRDHYKLALGQVNTAKNLIGGISKDYLRLMKYGDSLYRCKQLKRAALGRMCTVLKKLRAALGYLEEVRKHISRLPSLDPNTRTLLLTGYPNVGKSSFMNKVTRADVEVQPYAFTTKALFVGHMDHRFLRWQVVDTPGILDRPLEERNTIEMQAITALAHLQCCVLYFLDISEQCGFPIDQQLKLFESIQPLFANKQVMMIANKTDVLPYESLAAHHRTAIEESARRANAVLVPMSNISEENISYLKATACDKLLEARVDAKLASNRTNNDLMARLTVMQPKPRDNAARDAFIPDSVAATMDGGSEAVPTRVTEKQLMWAHGGPGVYSCDYRKYYLLEEDEWKFDTIPQFMDGKNVMDFFDADIEERLRNLDEEEAQLEASGAYDVDMDDELLDEEDMLLYEAITEKQAIAKAVSHETKSRLPKQIQIRGRSEAAMREQLENVGLESDGVMEHARGRKRGRSAAAENQDNAAMEGVEGGDDNNDEEQARVIRRAREMSRGRSKSVQARSRSATRGPTEQSVPPTQMRQVEKSKKTMERQIFRYARGGEADRRHYPKLVKHMNSGKRSLGTSTIGR